MPVKLKVFTNEDDALLFWSIPRPIPQCRGFAIKRRRRVPDESNPNGGQVFEEVLENRIGFENEPAPARLVRGQIAVTKPSTVWPFQRFSWTDHETNIGETVSYQVVPILRDATGILVEAPTQASPFSEPTTLGAPSRSRFKPFFNRGFVMSQFMARFLQENNLTLKQFKDNIRDQDDKTIRLFLAGDLRVALLRELKTAETKNGKIFAALFELSDDELINALCAIGKRAHVVLANGSISKRKDETSVEARRRDANEDARRRLRATGVDVEVDEFNRFLSPGALGHNKFMVRTDANDQPITAWTGSTNWSTTGLCTQLNNGLLIEDSNVAKVFLDQWKRLKAEASGFSKPFLVENSQPKQVGDDIPGQPRSHVWFTRANRQVDLTALRAEVMAAREGILFLMFMPGSTGLFSTVAARSAEPNLFVRGVVSELPNGREDAHSIDVNLIDGDRHNSFHLDIIEPEGNGTKSIARFAEEVTRKQFLSNIGHAIIHSKVVVIDPFSPDPVVITGSHNFSASASGKNDENFIIIKGDRELAEAYAVNIMSAYDHYRFRAFLSQTNKPFNGLKDNDRWQAPMMAAKQRDLRFWGV